MLAIFEVRLSAIKFEKRERSLSRGYIKNGLVNMNSMEIMLIIYSIFLVTVKGTQSLNALLVKSNALFKDACEIYIPNPAENG